MRHYVWHGGVKKFGQLALIEPNGFVLNQQVDLAFAVFGVVNQNVGHGSGFQLGNNLVNALAQFVNFGHGGFNLGIECGISAKILIAARLRVHADDVCPMRYRRSTNAAFGFANRCEWHRLTRQQQYRF